MWSNTGDKLPYHRSCYVSVDNPMATQEARRKSSMSHKGIPLTKEHRKAISESLKGILVGDRNPSKRPEARERVSKWSKEQWVNMSDEERDRRYIATSHRSKKYWANLSLEERTIHSRNISKGVQNFMDNASDDWKQAHSNSIKKAWERQSPDEIQIRIKKLNDGAKAWWINLPQEKKDELNEINSKHMKKHWDNLSEEEKKNWIRGLHKRPNNKEQYLSTILSPFGFIMNVIDNKRIGG